MNICFSKDSWNLEELTYAYSCRFPELPEFVQKSDCIESCKNEQSSQGYDYISLLAKKPFGSGTKISIRCGFDRYGAPLIMLADKVEKDQQGILRYRNYLEIVLYEDGVNVWKLWDDQGTIRWKKLMHVHFPVTAVEAHDLSVLVEGDVLKIEADGHYMELRVEGMFPSWYGGITACEGINRFYYLNIEENQ